MDRSQILALYDQDQRKDMEHPGLRREVTPHVVRHVSLSGVGGGLVSYSQLTAANAQDIIREQIRYFESIGQDFEWKLYDHDQPSDLIDRLRSQGFTVEGAEAIMVLDLHHTPDSLRRPVHHAVRRITDPAALVDVQTVRRQVWGEDTSGQGDYLAGALRQAPDQMSVYVAYVGDQPASAAWIQFAQHSQFASLWGGSTVPAFRHRGLYTALVAVRTQEALARQARFLTVDALPTSRPILEKLGFETIAMSHPCQWHRSP